MVFRDYDKHLHDRGWSRDPLRYAFVHRATGIHADARDVLACLTPHALDAVLDRALTVAQRADTVMYRLPDGSEVPVDHPLAVRHARDEDKPRYADLYRERRNQGLLAWAESHDTQRRFDEEYRCNFADGTPIPVSSVTQRNTEMRARQAELRMRQRQGEFSCTFDPAEPDAERTAVSVIEAERLGWNAEVHRRRHKEEGRTVVCGGPKIERALVYTAPDPDKYVDKDEFAAVTARRKRDKRRATIYRWALGVLGAGSILAALTAAIWSMVTK